MEEKKPAVNLAELLKQTGIVDDDESFFMDDDPLPPPVQAPPPPPPAPTQTPNQVQIQMDQQIPPVETKENNVRQQQLKMTSNSY